MSTPDNLAMLTEDGRFLACLNKFQDLIEQGELVVLLGAGCSKCADLPLTTELLDKVLQIMGNSPSKELLQTIRGMYHGEDDGTDTDFKGADDAQQQISNAHIEDYLSELIDLLAMAERRVYRCARDVSVPVGDKQYCAEQLRSAVQEIKGAIVKAIDTTMRIDAHRQFVSALHRPTRVGKSGINRVDYIVLNYDTAIEEALALERIPFTDGLDGGVSGWWNPDNFRRDDVAARVIKLHGSINWFELEGDPLPRRIASNLELPLDKRRILIWPASTKYRQTQLDPYAELMRVARAAMSPEVGKQRVLMICGYSFGDAHVNTEIERALRSSKGNLSLIGFTSKVMPVGMLEQWRKDEDIGEQILVFARQGFYHGPSDAVTSEKDLPWWKFENITRLLGGQR